MMSLRQHATRELGSFVARWIEIKGMTLASGQQIEEKEITFFVAADDGRSLSSLIAATGDHCRASPTT